MRTGLGSGSGMDGLLAATSPLTWVVAVLVLGVGFPLSIWRLKVRGPALGWVPKRFRQRTNDWYVRHGWAAPYDAQGRKRQTW